MAIAIDATSQGEVASGTSLTVSHTCSGADRLLLVAVSEFFSPTPALSTATYAGVAMTRVGTILFGSVNAERATLFSLAAPATGANNIVVTAGQAATEIVLAATSWTGVDQTTPLDTAGTTAPDNVTSVSQAIASAVDDLVVDMVGWYNQTITVGAGQTLRVENNNAATVNSVAVSTEPGAASVTMSWSWAAAEYPGHIAVNMNAAAAGGMTPAAGSLVLAGAAPSRVIGTVLTPVTP